MREDPVEARARFRVIAESTALRCKGCGKAIRHRKMTEAECVDRQMSERTLQDRVLYRAKKYGWRVAHVGRGWVGGDEEHQGVVVTPMAKGWPDLTLAKEGHRLLFFELKREQGTVEPEQWEWLWLLNACGARAVVIRPGDLRSGTVERILKEGTPLA